MTRTEIHDPEPGTRERFAPSAESRADATPPTRAPTRKRVGSLLGSFITILLIGGAVYAAYHYLVPHGRKATGRPGHGNGPPPTVGVATVGRGDIDLIIQALGTVTPLANVTVKTQINGQLIQVGFKEGQIVKAGDFLAQIDPRPYEALLHQYEGQLARDQGLLAEAIADNQRYQTLLKQTSIARQTAEDQKYVVQQDQGTVKADEGLVEAQKVNLAFCHITAPVSGRVGLRQVDPGNYVQTSDTNGIVILTQLQPISVVFSMPENVISEVVDAQKKNAQLEADAFDQANLHQLAVGHLETLDNTIDTTTGQLKARATFENTTFELFPNQFVNIHLKVGQLRNTLVVPTAAVQRGSIGTFAYVVGSDGKVSVRKIGLGAIQGANEAVESGLHEGDRVVVDGTDRLKEGMHVNVAGPPSKDADGAPQAGGTGKHSGGRHGHAQP